MSHCFRDMLLGRVRWWSAVALLAGGWPAAAHGPFDHSARLVVGGTRLELVVTMGADATQAFLAAAGLPPDKAREVVSRGAGQPPFALPPALGARLVEMRAGDQVLAGGEVHAITEGLETLFTVAFPRPRGSALEVRALYFNGIEAMKQGAFVAVDENQVPLATALWSRANDAVRIALPAAATETSGEPMTNTATETVASPQVGSSAPPAVAPVRRGAFPIGAKLLALVGVLLVMTLVVGRWIRSRPSP